MAPDLPGPREALVIATTRYKDPELRQLRAPAEDAQDLAEVLSDPGIGAFTVTQVIDADEPQARRAIDAFLSGRGAGDVVVVYLSSHGVLDRRNRLYFAAADTVKDQLSSTGISATWLLDQLEDCRARQQVLILDCCFSGAFAHGSKGDADLDLERRLAGPGRGRAVLTASRAGEYSFEGQALPGAAVSGSVFTAGLIEGLRTGAADAGRDGYISVDEAYDYAYRYVQASGASQTPQRWLSGGEGAIVLARSPAGIAVTPAALPEDLAASLDSRYPGVRIGAVHELGGWLAGDDPARALTAERKLREIADTDNPAVAAAARTYLPAANQQPAAETDLDAAGTDIDVELKRLAGGPWASVNTEDLKRAARQMPAFASTEADLVALRSVMLTFAEPHLDICATDRFRLDWRRLSVHDYGTDPFSALVDATDFGRVKYLTGETALVAYGPALRIWSGGGEIALALIDKSYPEIEPVIQVDGPVCRVRRLEFIEAVNRIVSSQPAGDPVALLMPTNDRGTLVVRVSNENALKTGTEEVSVTATGTAAADGTVITVNQRYLLEALDVFEEQYIYLSSRGANQPLLLLNSAEAATHRHVIMPIRSAGS